MKQQPNETDAAFAVRSATTSRIVSNAPKSSTGWFVFEVDGVVTVEAAPASHLLDDDERLTVHRTREAVEASVAWSLYVTAEHRRLAVTG